MHKSIIGAAVVLALAWTSGGSPAAAGESGKIDWSESLSHAVAEAGDSGRPIIVDVWAVWCAPCKVMEETTYRDERVVELMSRMVPLKIDIDNQQGFELRYRIEAYPTVLFLDASGDEITREPGFATADELLALMQRVLDGYDTYVAARERFDDPAAVDGVVDYLMGLNNPYAAGEYLRKVLKHIKGNPPGTREAVDVRLAEAQLAEGKTRAASKSFARLAQDASEPDVRGRALVGLVRAERERGNGDGARMALDRLRAEFPDLARQVAE